jgi:hypothetical protein
LVALAKGLAFQVVLDREFASAIPSLVGLLASHPQKELNRFRRLRTIHEDDNPLRYKNFIVMKYLFASPRIEIRETAPRYECDLQRKSHSLPFHPHGHN